MCAHLPDTLLGLPDHPRNVSSKHIMGMLRQSLYIVDDGFAFQ